jgi:hypothetical protein
MLGGLARRATAIERARKGGPPLLLLESGNFLFKGKPRTKDELAAARRKAGLILRAYRRMGYDAVLPGGADFTAGFSLLKGREGSGVPFTSLNLVSASGEKAVFPPFLSIARGGVRVLVVGVLGEGAIPRDTLSDLGWMILPAESALSGFLQGKVAAAANLVVVLTQLSPGENLAVTRSSPVPVILLSPPSRGVAAPVFAAGSAILLSRDKGTHLLEVTVGSGAGDLARAGFAEEGAAKRHEEKRRQLLMETASMEEHRRALYVKTLEAYDNAIRDVAGKRELSSRWIPLDANIPDDPNVASMIERYRQESP